MRVTSQLFPVRKTAKIVANTHNPASMHGSSNGATQLSAVSCGGIAAGKGAHGHFSTHSG